MKFIYFPFKTIPCLVAKIDRVLASREIFFKTKTDAMLIFCLEYHFEKKPASITILILVPL